MSSVVPRRALGHRSLCPGDIGERLHAYIRSQARKGERAGVASICSRYALGVDEVFQAVLDDDRLDVSWENPIRRNVRSATAPVRPFVVIVQPERTTENDHD